MTSKTPKTCMPHVVVLMCPTTLREGAHICHAWRWRPRPWHGINKKKAFAWLSFASYQFGTASSASVAQERLGLFILLLQGCMLMENERGGAQLSVVLSPTHPLSAHACNFIFPICDCVRKDPVGPPDGTWWEGNPGRPC